MRKISASLLATALATMSLVGISAGPAGAGSVTTVLDCQGKAALGSSTSTQNFGITTTAPASVAPGGTFTVSATIDPQTLPASDNSVISVNLLNFKDFKLKIPVPTGATFVSATLSGGSNLGTGTNTITQSSNVITMSVPGKIPGGSTFQFPTMNLTFQASGSAGTKVEPVIAGSSYAIPGYTFSIETDNAFVGTINTSCWPSTNPALSSTTIGVAPSITAATPPAGKVGQAYSYSFTASGSPSPTFSVASGALPAGLSLSSAGVLSGTPTTAGTSTFTVAASNGIAPDATSASVDLTVDQAPAITAASPPSSATVGTPYSYTFTASGTPVPTFSVSSGSLPAGLSLSSAGVLSGTPTTGGVSTFKVSAGNGVAPDAATADLTITVSGPPSFTASSPDPEATTGVAYSYTFQASGYPAPTFTVSSGALPAGLSLSTGGVLSGTPTTVGSSTFRIGAANGVAPDAETGDITIDVSAPANPLFVDASPPSTVTVGTPYVPYTFTATGAPAPTFAVVAPADLPAGMTLGSDGVLSGTPTESGDFTFTVTATNGVAPDATTSVTITVAEVPTVTAPALPGAIVGSAYSATFTATGWPAPTFSVAPAGGTAVLPAGFAVDAGTGVVSWTPSAADSVTFEVTVTNAAGSATTAELTILAGVAEAPVFTASTPPDGAVGQAYSYQFDATGWPLPTFAIDAPSSLPAGMSFTADGVLSGTPTESGDFGFTVTATNGVAPDATVTATLTVTEVPTVTAPALPGAVVGSAYSATFTATGWPTPTFSVDPAGTTATLPAGFGIDANTGVLSWTPSAAGPVTFTVTVTNAAGSATTADLTLVAGMAPGLTAFTPPDGAVGQAYSYQFDATGWPLPTFSVGAPADLPAGMTLGSDGLLSGTPTESGDFGFTVTATNGVAPDATVTATLTVTEVPTVTAPALPGAVVGSAYSATFTATGWPTPTFGVDPAGTTATLPAGFGIDANTGVLSWTPSAAGPVTFTVTVTNDVQATSTANLTITAMAPEAPAVTAPALPDALVGKPYSATFTATGWPAPTFGVDPAGDTAVLPVGLAVNPNTGVLSWTPSEAGSVTFTVTAANDSGSATTGELTITVTDTPPVPPPSWTGWNIARAVVADPTGPGGWTLDGFGGVHAWGGAPQSSGAPVWRGWDIARDVAVDGAGRGYVLDGWGGLHPVGGAPAVSGARYWSGFDIARKVVLNPAGPGGWVLNGWGAIHEFGGAPRLRSTAYWRGWDIARDLVVNPDGRGGYLLDGWGGIHPVGNAAKASGAPYWKGFDIARAIALNPSGPGGWVLDGWGGIHPFGGAPRLDGGGYWPGRDIAKDLSVRPDGTGYQLDGWGGVHPVARPAT